MTNKEIRKKVDKLYDKRTRIVRQYHDRMEDTERILAKIQSFCEHKFVKRNDYTYDKSLVCQICDKIIEEDLK